MRNEIKQNPGLDIRLRILIDCEELIGPKFISVAVWLLASGEQGLTVSDLRNITGFGSIAVENTIEVLINSGKAIKLDPTLAGDPLRYTLNLGPLKKKKREEKKYIQGEKKGGKGGKGGGKIVRKKPKRIKQPTEINSKSESVDSDELETNSGNNKQNNVSGKIISKNPSLLEVKVLSNSPRDILTNAKSERYKVSRKNYKQNPSRNPILLEWQHKKLTSKWGPLDWVGYWLHKWLECYGVEDSDFQGHTLYKTIGESTKKSNGKPDKYWRAGFRIDRFRKANSIAKKDMDEVAKYIDWLFGEYLPGATWIKDLPGTRQVFRIEGNHFFDSYKKRDMKAIKAGKGKGRWVHHHYGYEYEED